MMEHEILNDIMNMGIGGVIAFVLIKYLANRIDIMNQRLERIAIILEELKDKLEKQISV